MEPRINADERGWEGKGQRTGATDSNSVSAAGLSGAFSVLFPPRGSAFIRGFRSRSCRQTSTVSRFPSVTCRTGVQNRGQVLKI